MSSSDNKNNAHIVQGKQYKYTYEEIQEIANFLKKKIGTFQPIAAIICGTGLGAVSEVLVDPTIMDYSSIPNFPRSTAIGHAGRLFFGTISKVPVMCLQGRFHFYEGHSLSTCVMPVRLMKLLGVKLLLVSNAAGSVNPAYKVGDVMFIKDHINFVGFSGQSPLTGPNDERWGERFVPLNNSYHPEMNRKAAQVAKELGMKGIREGVYACVAGPTYETVAEMRMLKIVGADAVGMSTVHEVIAAKHCGINCLGFSLITDEGVLDYETDKQPDGQTIIAMAEAKKEELKKFVERLIPELIALI